MPKITPIEKSKTIDYGSVEHTDIWLKRDVSQIPAFAGQKMEVSAQNSVICVMSESLDSNTTELLFNLAERENRVYILVDSISKDMEENLQKKSLIRHSKNITGSFILDISKKSGFFFNGSMNTPDAICLLLDKEQVEILYRYFCCNFWQTEPDSPIDVFPNYDNFCDKSFIQKMITDKEEIAFVSAIQSEIKSSKIITSLKGNNNNCISKMAKDGTKILALEKENSIYAIENENGMFIIPKSNIASNDISWALKLNKDQEKRIKDYLHKIEENADYEFFTSKKRSELSNKDILQLRETNNIHIESNKTETLKDNILNELLPQNDLENEKPNFMDDGKSIQITYKWKNIPFYLPQNANKHNLYGNWEDEIKKIGNFLDGILQKIDEVEKKESSLAKAISGLFWGKKIKFDSLKTEINELKKFDFANATNDKLKEKITKINEIYHQAKTGMEEIDEENRKAKIDENITTIKKEIAEKEEQMKNLELEKVEKENIAKDEKKTEKEISTIKSKYQSDIDKTKNEIRRLNNEIEQKEKQKKAIPTYKQETSSLEVFNKKQSTKNSQSELTVPSLQYLPKTGTLWQSDGKTYLAIKDWDDFDLGKQEAKRLSARLCAERS
jgi:hypothetical protein